MIKTPIKNSKLKLIELSFGGVSRVGEATSVDGFRKKQSSIVDVREAILRMLRIITISNYPRPFSGCDARDFEVDLDRKLETNRR